MNYLHYTIFSLLILFVGIVQTTSVKAQKESPVKVRQIDEKQQTEEGEAVEDSTKQEGLSLYEQKDINKYFFAGITAKLKDNEEAAIQNFEKCLGVDEQHDAALYELAKIHFNGNEEDLATALNYIETASKIAPENKWYLYLKGNIFAKQEQFAEAAKTYQQLIKLTPDQIEYYYDLAEFYIRDKQYENALQTYTEVEKRIGFNFDISKTKQRLYVELGRINEGVAHLQQLIEDSPNDLENYHLLAELYELSNKKEEAIALYEKILEKSPNDPAATLSLAQHYYHAGEKEKWFAALKSAFSSDNLPLSDKLIMLEQYVILLRDGKIDGKNSQKMLELAETVANSHEDSSGAQSMYAELLLTNQKTNEALAAYKKAVEIDANQFRTWYQIMQLEADLDLVDDLLADSRKAIELFPEQALPYFFNGWGYMQQKNYEKAVKKLKRGALISGDNADMSFQMYSLLGSAYNSLKEYENSDKYYDKAIKIYPDDPTTLNNYSYYLALREADLDKAAEMSAKSNELAPDQASFQDTYGYILYKQSKYKKAKEWFEKALNNGGNESATILEHHGDALFQLKNIDEAVKQWQVAKQHANEAEQLERLEKKIRDKQIYE